MTEILPTFNNAVEGNEGIIVTIALAVISTIAYIVVNYIKSYFDSRIKQQNEKILCPQHTDENGDAIVKYDSQGRRLDSLEDRLYHYMDKSVDTVTAAINDVKEDVKEVKRDAKELNSKVEEHIDLAIKDHNSLKQHFIDDERQFKELSSKLGIKKRRTIKKTKTKRRA